MLRDRLSDDLKTAMKAGDKPRVSTIRLIQAALKDRDIEARGAGKGPLSDDDILGLLQKMLKQRQESVDIYDKNSRPELAAGERAEMAIIGEFMPKQLDDTETAVSVEAAIAETGATTIKDMGKVVGKLRADFAGRMDFGKASAMVKARLSGA
jgi:uncharacterized protein YqeY